MAQSQVAQAKIGEHFDLFSYRSLRGKECHAFFNGHVQHVVDSLTAERDFERLAVESCPLAGAARHFDVRHEVKLRGDHSFALALLAASSLDIEAESAGLVSALDGKRSLSEQVADKIVESDIRRGIRPAVPPDRRLIDVDDFMDVLDSVDAVMLARQRARIHKPFPKRLVENLIDQSALSGSRSAGDRDHATQWERDIDRLKIVFTRSPHDQRFAVAFAPLFRSGDRPLS